jgi:hypothetical protein
MFASNIWTLRRAERIDGRSLSRFANDVWPTTRRGAGGRGDGGGAGVPATLAVETLEAPRRGGEEGGQSSGSNGEIDRLAAGLRACLSLGVPSGNEERATRPAISGGEIAPERGGAGGGAWGGGGAGEGRPRRGYAPFTRIKIKRDVVSTAAFVFPFIGTSLRP